MPTRVGADYDIMGGDEVIDWAANPRYDRQVSRVSASYEGTALSLLDHRQTWQRRQTVQ